MCVCVCEQVEKYDQALKVCLPKKKFKGNLREQHLFCFFPQKVKETKKKDPRYELICSFALLIYGGEPFLVMISEFVK